MGRVVASIKIFPEDIIIGIDEIKEAIENSLPEDIEIHKFVEEPIAFGLIALIAHLIIPEAEGRLDSVENTLMNIRGVSQIETQMVRRI